MEENTLPVGGPDNTEPIAPPPDTSATSVRSRRQFLKGSATAGAAAGAMLLGTAIPAAAEDTITPLELQFITTVDRIFADADFRALIETDPAAALATDGWVLTPEQIKSFQIAPALDMPVESDAYMALPRVRPAVQVVTRTRTSTNPVTRTRTATSPAVRVVTKGTRPVVSVVVQTVIPIGLEAEYQEWGPDPAAPDVAIDPRHP